MITVFLLLGATILSDAPAQGQAAEALLLDFFERGLSDDQIGQPNGSVERIDVDLNGDGRAEIILSDSGRRWWFYSQDEEGFTLLGNMWFLYLCPEGPGMFSSVHADGVQPNGTLGYHRVDAAPLRIVALETQDLSDSRWGEYNRVRTCHKQLEQEGKVVVATFRDLREARKGYAELWTNKETRRPVSGLARIVDSPSEVPAAAAVLPYSPDDSWQEEKNLAEHFAWLSQLRPEDTYTAFLFQLDVTADGVPELFIQRGYGPGPYWHVYSPRETNYSYLGLVTLQDSSWRFEEETGLLVTEQSLAQDLTIYKIDETGIHKNEVAPPTKYESVSYS